MPTKRPTSRWGYLALIGTVFTTVFTTACASTREPEPQPEPARRVTDDPAPAQTMALKPVRIVQVPPDRSYLDLGPVLVSDKDTKQDPQQLLQVHADALGADGLILEGRSFENVYLIKDAAWREKSPRLATAADVAVGVAAFLYTGFPLRERAMATRKQVFYRAFRYADGVVPPLPVDKLLIDEALRDALGEATSLEQQLMLAHAMLAASDLDVAAYTRLRTCLIGRRQCG